jgi:hypothetical protein
MMVAVSLIFLERDHDEFEVDVEPKFEHGFQTRTPVARHNIGSGRLSLFP